MTFDRGEYGLMYHQTFGKTAGREACRDGWRRWQKVRASGATMLVLQPHGAPGYDISYVPGPPGQRAMFNFRAVFNAAPEQTEGMLDMARALPLPEWRPPPH